MDKARGWKRAGVIAVSFLLLSSCGTGGGGSGNGNNIAKTADDYINFVNPPNGSGLNHGASPSFLLHNADKTVNRNGVYEITVFDDSEMTQVLDKISGLVEDKNGSVIFQSEITSEGDKQYWWRWSATFETDGGQESVESEKLSFVIVNKQAARVLSPRSGGYMDVNNTQSAALAVYNAYTGEDADISYDFELYANSDMTSIVAAATAVAQDNDETYTSFFPAVKLSADKTYYWIARPVVGGVPLDWRSVNSFTVRNFCDIRRTRYAEYYYDMTFRQECSEIAFTDPVQALGAPNATGEDNSTYRGFFSLSFGGSVGFEMGRTIVNGPGLDILLYEYRSIEPLELLAGQSEIGPWLSLGVEWCEATCGFDLASAGLNYARFIKVKDMGSIADACHETSGSDIDALAALNVASTSIQCDVY